jgi:hypothetical protein
MATKYKKYDEEEFKKMYRREYPTLSVILNIIGKVIGYGIVLLTWFIIVTVFYVVIKWAMGVWV